MDERAFVNLRDFIRTGKFAGVQLGATEADVKSLLGEPDDVGGISRRQRRPLIWKYGDFEFHFLPDSDRLWMIYVEIYGIPRGSRRLALDPWIMRRELPREELVSALAALDLDPMVRKDPLLESWIVTSSSGLAFAYCLAEAWWAESDSTASRVEVLYAFDLATRPFSSDTADRSDSPSGAPPQTAVSRA